MADTADIVKTTEQKRIDQEQAELELFLSKAFLCPWGIVKGMCDVIDHVKSVLHTAPNVYVYECDENTFKVDLYISTYARKKRVNGHRVSAASTHKHTLRVERFKLLQQAKLVNLFDTVYAATRRDKASAEIMLEMLGESLGGI